MQYDSKQAGTLVCCNEALSPHMDVLDHFIDELNSGDTGTYHAFVYTDVSQICGEFHNGKYAKIMIVGLNRDLDFISGIYANGIVECVTFSTMDAIIHGSNMEKAPQDRSSHARTIGLVSAIVTVVMAFAAMFTFLSEYHKYASVLIVASYITSCTCAVMYDRNE